jgi:phage terminase small subunit
MPVLSNPRHERFSQELAAGKSASDAYVAAGYRANTGNASTLKAQESISKRVEELLAARERVERKAMERAIERTTITKERVLTELAKIGFANMADYMTVGPDGDPRPDFSALTRDQMAALTEVTVEEFLDGRGEDARQVRRTKFRLADKKGALVDIARHLGMFVDRREQGRPGEFAEMSNEELDGRLIATLMERRMTVEQATEFINRVPRKIEQPADPGDDPASAEKRWSGDGGAGSGRGGVGEGRGIAGSSRD